MIKIENAGIYGWEEAIRGMRNPMNSWSKSDSFWSEITKGEYIIGNNDLGLMLNLSKAGPVHAKFRRMIVVWVDITAPLYWWKEFDTYKIGTVANSCSTMHKIHEKEFTFDDFSHEHLISNDFVNVGKNRFSNAMVLSSKNMLEVTIDFLNYYRTLYLATDERRRDNDCRCGDPKTKKELIELMKLYWWQMIQLLPSSYNQKRTIMLSYEVLAGMRPYRKNHKLDEWRVLSDWIDTLPHSEIITGEEPK